MARTDADISHIPHGQTEGGRQNAFLDGQAPPLHPMTVLLPEPQYDIATKKNYVIRYDIATKKFYVIRVKKFRPLVVIATPI